MKKIFIYSLIAFFSALTSISTTYAAAPNTPTINSPTNLSGSSANQTQFNIYYVATDPDGDAIKYEIDKNNDGVADSWDITSSPSGTLVYAAVTYNSNGTYLLRVRATQANNTSLKSAWSLPVTITITTYPQSTGCWTQIVSSSWGSVGCTESGGGNGSSPAYFTPQGSTVNGVTPVCDGGSSGPTTETVNTSLYPNSFCYADTNTITNSYACGGYDYRDDVTYYVDGGTCNNNFPAKPIISGQNTGNINVATANFVIATDPENDALYYELDWDGNGSVDGTTGVFAAGTSVAIGHTYTSSGTYSVKARAVQSNDILKKSMWSNVFTISIGASYNCEAGSLDPGLSIVSNNSLLGVALNSSMRWFHNIFSNGSSPACFRNASGNNYFVPTKTQVERDAFMNHLPAGVTKGGF
jgi:hypothetical protein